MSSYPDAQPSISGNIVSTGWIGTHPVDFGDFPFLLLYTPADGAVSLPESQAALREIAEAWGLREGAIAENPVIGGTPVVAALDGHDVALHGLPGLTPLYPTSEEWAQIARRRGQVFVSLCTRPWPDGPTADMDRVHTFVQDPFTVRESASMLVPVRQP